MTVYFNINTFANPTRIAGMGNFLTAVSCLDYFSANERATLESKCGTWDGFVIRTIAPIGGTAFIVGWIALAHAACRKQE